MADLIQHRYFATEEAYSAAKPKDTDICFIGSTGRIVARSKTFGNAQSVLESLNTYKTATDSRLNTLEGYFDKTNGSADKADTVKVTQYLINNIEYPILWTHANANTGYTQLFKTYDNMTFNPAAKRITVGSGGGFKISGGTSSQFLKADGSVDSQSYMPFVGGTTSNTFALNAYAIYLNTNTEIYLKRKFDTGDKTICVASDSIRPSNIDSHGYFNFGVNHLRFKNGYFSETVYADSFSGSLTGRASEATNLYLRYNETANAIYPIVWSANASSSEGVNEIYKSPSKLYFNPSTGYVTATGFNGKIGSSTIGGTTTPIYLKDGNPTACTMPTWFDTLMDSNTKIKSDYLPSYVDDVLEYANLTALKAVTGETGKIYVTTDDNKVYRWTGSAYMEINSNVSSADNAVNATNATNATYANQLKTARKLTIGSTGKTFDGTADVAWTGAEIGLDNYLPKSGGTVNGRIDFFAGSTDNVQLNCPNGNFYVSATGGIGLMCGSTQNAVVMASDSSFRPISNSSALVSLGTSKSKFKDGYFTDTVYATTFSGALSGNATSATTATIANTIATPRTLGDCNTLATTANTSTFCEVGYSVANRPTEAYYYILSGQGTDIAYQSQLALGETIDSVYFRRKHDNTWQAWKKLAFTTDTVAAATTADTANKVANSFTIQKDGTSIWSYDGSAARILNIKPGSNISLGVDGNNLTINSSYTNTTYSAGSGLAMSGTTINHASTITAGSTNSNTTAQTVGFSGSIPIPKLTYNATGHITGVSTINYNLPANPNTDTKVTAVGNHYTPASGTTKATTASGATLAFGGDVITGVNVDAAGHIYSLTTSKLPSNPNTDTKVTAVGNHYTPTTNTSYNLGSSSTTNLSFGANVVTGLQRDAAGHVTGLLTSPLPNSPSVSVVNKTPTLSWGTISEIGTVNGTALKVAMPAVPSITEFKEYTLGSGTIKTMAEIMTYLFGRFYTSDVRTSYTLNVTTQNTVLYNGYGDLTITVNMNGWDYANIIVVGNQGSTNGKTLIIQTDGGDDIYENADCGLITTTSSKNIVEASIVKSSYGTFVSMRNYGQFT
jgi:hypothetical protein